MDGLKIFGYKYFSGFMVTASIYIQTPKQVFIFAKNREEADKLYKGKIFKSYDANAVMLYKKNDKTILAIQYENLSERHFELTVSEHEISEGLILD